MTGGALVEGAGVGAALVVVVAGVVVAVGLVDKVGAVDAGCKIAEVRRWMDFWIARTGSDAWDGESGARPSPVVVVVVVVEVVMHLSISRSHAECVRYAWDCHRWGQTTS